MIDPKDENPRDQMPSDDEPDPAFPPNEGFDTLDAGDFDTKELSEDIDS